MANNNKTLILLLVFILCIGTFFLIPAALSDWTTEGPTWANTSYDDTRIQRATDNIIIDWNPGNWTSHWTFDENTGTDVHDENVTNTNDGTLVGNWTTGKYGSAINISHVNNLVNITADPSLEGFSELTICAWINPQDTAGYDWGRIVSKSGPTSITDDYALSRTAGPGDNGEIGFRVSTDEGTTTIKSSTQTINDTWYHACGRWRESDGYMDVVIAGAIDGTPGTQTGTLIDSNRNLGIGRHAYDNSGNRSFYGYVDEAYIIGRYLSLVEIQDLANNTMVTYGNVTIYHDEGAGYVLDEIEVYADTGDGSETNYTVWSRENATGNYTKLSQNQLVGNSVTTPNPVVQNNDIQIRIIGDGYTTTKISSVVLTAIQSQPNDPSNLSNTTGDYWANFTWNKSSDADVWQVMIVEV